MANQTPAGRPCYTWFDYTDPTGAHHDVGVVAEGPAGATIEFAPYIVVRPGRPAWDYEVKRPRAVVPVAALRQRQRLV